MIKQITKHFLVAILMLGFSTVSHSQLKVSGSLDAYGRGNLNADTSQVPATSFANKAGFALGMANLVFSYEREKVGAVLDLVAGPRGKEAVFNATGSSNLINQLYVYWKASEKVTFTLGNFNTFLGYEVISPTGNFNYSTTYAFSYGPFSHTGLKMDYQMGKAWSLSLAVMNATDNTDFNITGSYTFGAQLGYKGQYLNVLVGNQGQDNYGVLTQVDYTGGFNVSKSFYLGLNLTYNSTSGEQAIPKRIPDKGYYAVALYPQIATSEHFSLGLRGEYFKEFGNFGAIGTKKAEGNVWSLTLSGNYQIAPSLMLIPELRYDNASERIFEKGGEQQDNIASALFAVVYNF